MKNIANQIPIKDSYRVWLKTCGSKGNDSAWRSLPEHPQEFATDSRSIMPGQWFVPISGASFDGHKFISAAMEKGASGFFFAADAKLDLPASQLALGIAVNEPLAALQAITKGWRQSMDQVTLAALTGSVGKTTCKEMLATLFSHAGPTLSASASFNNELGVPKTLQRINSNHQFAVLELAARHVGDIAFLTDLALPDIAGVLNVGDAHIGEFGSKENIYKTKTEIFRHGKPGATLIAFGDDQKILAAAQHTAKRCLSFGLKSHNDVYVKKVADSRNGSLLDITLQCNDGELNFQMQESHSAYPVLSAACAAFALAANIDHKTIEAGLAQFSGAKRRFEILKVKDKIFIDDAYNANPQSMRSGLTSLRQRFPDQRVMVVLGDMLELGNAAQKEHEAIGEYCINEVKPSYFVCIGNDARTMFDAAKATGQEKNLKYFRNIEDASKSISEEVSKVDVVYFKASNGLHFDRLIASVIQLLN